MMKSGPEASTNRRTWLVLAAAVIAISLALAVVVAFSIPHDRAIEGGGLRLEFHDRVRTGHQRAERLVFLDQGRRLAVACPRYNRVVVYRLRDDGPMSLDLDIPLEGRPVALAATADRLIVLQRPSGDARHVEEAWWDEFARDGTRTEARFRVGFDPDDLVLSPDGRLAIVLCSGRAEGEHNRPAPGLLVVDRSTQPARKIAALEFPNDGDDPERLAWDPASGRAWVALRDSHELLSLDLSEASEPRWVGRIALSSSVMQPASLTLDPAGTIWLTDAEHGGLWFVTSDATAGHAACDWVVADAGIPFGMVGAASHGALDLTAPGKVSLRLPAARFGDFQPVSLASDLGPDGGWIALSDRSGSVETIRLKVTGPSAGSPSP